MKKVCKQIGNGWISIRAPIRKLKRSWQTRCLRFSEKVKKLVRIMCNLKAITAKVILTACGILRRMEFYVDLFGSF